MKLSVYILFALPALAQPLPQLVEEALRGNREILAAQKKYESARQRLPQAGSLPDPMVSLGYGSQPTSTAGVMVSQDLPAPGKRGLRTGIAAAEASAEWEDYLAIRLSVVSRLRQAYHQLHHADAAIRFVGRYQDLLANMVHIAEARYAVGRAAQQDVLKAQTQYSIFEAQLLRYRQERTNQEIEINALLNRPGGGRIDVADEMAPGELPATLDTMLAAARAHSPLLGREQKAIERAGLAGSLARRDAYPDYTIAGGYFNQGPMPPMWQLRLDVRLPVHRERLRAEVTEQVFAASQARHTYEAVGVALESQIRTQYAAAETAHKLIDLYQQTITPQAQLALESSLAGYQTGTLDFLSVFSNFMTVVDYELMYHEEVMQFHVALAKLEEMTGGLE